MNILQRGSLAVVVATFITSAMILSSENSVADNKPEKKIAIETHSLSVAEQKVPEKQLLNVGVEGKNNALAGKITPPPPPGPFLRLGNETNQNLRLESKSGSLVPPVAPKHPNLERTAPQQQALEQPVITNKDSKIIFKRTMPSLEQAMKVQPAPPATPSHPQLKAESTTPKSVETRIKETIVEPKRPEKIDREEVVAPKQPVELATKPTAPKVKKNEHNAPSHAVKQSKPMWMQKEILKKLAPSQPKQPASPQPSVQKQQGIQKNEHRNVYSTQRYMLAPMPMPPPNFVPNLPPSYGYPQMPVMPGSFGPGGVRNGFSMPVMPTQPQMMPAPSYNPYYQAYPNRAVPKGSHQ